MKMKREFLFILLPMAMAMVMFSSGAGMAQKGPTSELIEVKSKLEEMITNRFREIISTTLEKSAFDVSVQVKIVESKRILQGPLVTPQNEVAPSVNPLDGALGTVKAEELIKAYQSQLKALQTQEERTTVVRNQAIGSGYAIKSINVLVGIQNKLGKEYKTQFETWLGARVKSEFGATGTSEVMVIQAKPQEQPPPKTWFQKLADIQNIVALLVFGIILMTGILISKFVSSTDAVEQRKLDLQLHQLKTDPRDLESKDGKSGKQVQNQLTVSMMTEIKSIRDLTAKITVLATELNEKLGIIFSLWLDSGEERGRFKTAAIIDALISSGGLKTPDQSTIKWQLEVPEEYREGMTEVYRKMTSLTPDSKRKLLEEVYWDLISLKTLGLKSLKQPFDFFAQSRPEAISHLLNGQEPKVRALAVLYMRPEAQKQFVKTLDYPALEGLLTNTFSMEKILAKDIETVSEALKIQMTQGISRSDEKDVKSLIPRLIDSMSPEQEITTLRKLVTTLPDQGQSIKQSRAVLAFLDEWPDEKLKLVFASSTSDEVICLLRLMPDAATKILSCCPPRIATIVDEDLMLVDKINSEEKARHLMGLKNKLNGLITSGQISLTEIFVDSGENLAA